LARTRRQQHTVWERTFLLRQGHTHVPEEPRLAVEVHGVQGRRRHARGRRRQHHGDGRQRPRQPLGARAGRGAAAPAVGWVWCRGWDGEIGLGAGSDVGAQHTLDGGGAYRRWERAFGRCYRSLVPVAQAAADGPAYITQGDVSSTLSVSTPADAHTSPVTRHATHQSHPNRSRSRSNQTRSLTSCLRAQRSSSRRRPRGPCFAPL